MDSTATFPIGFDRSSRTPMTVLGAGPNVSRVTVSSSTVDVRYGVGIPRHDPSRGRCICPATEQRTERTAWSFGTQRPPRRQLLARHRPCQWRRYRAGRHCVGSADVGAAWVRSGSGCVGGYRGLPRTNPGSSRHSTRAPHALRVRVTQVSSRRARSLWRTPIGRDRRPRIALASLVVADARSWDAIPRGETADLWLRWWPEWVCVEFLGEKVQVGAMTRPCLGMRMRWPRSG